MLKATSPFLCWQVVASAHKMQDVCQNIQLGSRQFGEASYDRSDPSDFYTKALQMKLLMDAPEQVLRPTLALSQELECSS